MTGANRRSDESNLAGNGRSLSLLIDLTEQANERSLYFFHCCGTLEDSDLAGRLRRGQGLSSSKFWVSDYSRRSSPWARNHPVPSAVYVDKIVCRHNQPTLNSRSVSVSANTISTNDPDTWNSDRLDTNTSLLARKRGCRYRAARSRYLERWLRLAMWVGTKLNSAWSGSRWGLIGGLCV